MGTRELFCHPDTPARQVESVTVEYERRGDALWLRYHAELCLNALALPDPASAARADGLWKTTCFEAFLRGADGAGYVEYNFSPSSRWAAYAFDDYRMGMQNCDVANVPEIGLDASEGHFALEVEIGLADGELGLGLSAVIEEVDGTKSYWALAHPPGKPDFHHADCFALQLAAAGGA